MKHNDTVLRFVHYNDNFVKVWEHDGSQIFFSGAEVTYVVDGAEYKEFVNYGQDCLTPTVVTPAKSGWEFAGWRKDTVASGNVETSVVMNTEPITLYAVFKQELTETFISYNDTQTAKGNMYYNNGNTKYAAIAIPNGASYSGWLWRGWAADAAADASTQLVEGHVAEFGASRTYYGCYEKTITVTYYDNKTTPSYAYGVSYFSGSGNYKNPSFTLVQDDAPGWDELGWSITNKGDAAPYYSNGTTFERGSDITLYGLYSRNVRVTTVANGTSSYKDGTRYWAPAGYVEPTFTISNPTKSGATFQGWSATAGSTTVAVKTINGLTINNAYTSMTYYAVFKYDDLVIYNSSVSFNDVNGLARTATVNNTTYVTIGDIIYASARGNEAGTEDKESKRGTAYTLKSAASTNHSGIAVVLATRAYQDYGDANAKFQGILIHEAAKDFWTIKYTERSESLSTTAPYMDVYASIASTATTWMAIAGICVQKLTLTGGKTVVG